MPISTGNPVAWRITGGECEDALMRMVDCGEISQDEAHFLVDNADFEAIAENAAGEFDDWFSNGGGCIDDVIDRIAGFIRNDAAYKKMIAERPNE